MTFIPISALLGDNVVERSEAMPWYQGPPLLYHLEHVHIASDRNLIDVRFPVQWVIRPPAEQRGRLPRLRRPGRRRRDPAGRRGGRAAERPAHRRSPAIDTFDGPVAGGLPADVGGAAADRRHRRRARQHDRAPAEPADGLQQLRVPAVLDVRAAARARSRRYLVKHTTRTAMVGGVDVRYRIDVETLHRDESADDARAERPRRACTCELSSPLVFDSYRRNRVTGSLIVIDEATNETVAAGVILDTEVEDAPTPSRQDRAQPQRALAGLAHDPRAALGVARPRRRDAVVHGPAGRRQVDDRGRRRGAPDRRRPARPSCSTATTCATASTATSASTRTRAARTCAAPRTSRGCSPSRARSRWSASSAPTPPTARRPPRCTRPTSSAFIEIFVRRPAGAVRAARPQGPLRARARRASSPGMTGVGAPYEAPAEPDLVLGSHDETVEEEVERVIELLAERGHRLARRLAARGQWPGGQRTSLPRARRGGRQRAGPCRLPAGARPSSTRARR